MLTVIAARPMSPSIISSCDALSLLHSGTGSVWRILLHVLLTSWSSCTCRSHAGIPQLLGMSWSLLLLSLFGRPGMIGCSTAKSGLQRMHGCTLQIFSSYGVIGQGVRTTNRPSCFGCIVYKHNVVQAADVPVLPLLFFLFLLLFPFDRQLMAYAPWRRTYASCNGPTVSGLRPVLKYIR